MRLIDAEYVEVRNGNTLLISCQGEHKCGGWLRVPLDPPFSGSEKAKPNPGECPYWKRIGDSLDDLTLKPSIDAGDCGHFNITNGVIEKC